MEIPCDFVVLALGSSPDQDSAQPLMEAFPDAVLIGDALRGRRMMEATAEGFLGAFHI